MKSIVKCGLAMTLLLALCLPARAAEQPGESELLQSIRQEQARARERRDSLKRLSDQERRLDTGLAEAEARILKLESGLEEQQDRMLRLAGDEEAAKREYDSLLVECQKTDAMLAELLKTLWELHSRRFSVGGRDLPDWPVTDREYVWSSELYKAVNAYRLTLDAQERDLNAALLKRENIGRQLGQRSEEIEREKARLLKDRVGYEQRLARLREEKSDAEAELASTLELIKNLNFTLKSVSGQGDIAKAKGRLSLPVSGSVKLRFRPEGRLPVNGLGFSAAQGSEVRAVYSGKVVFADTMRGRGQVVVLQHGKEYFSVYSFLSESSVSPGQDVSPRQLLGRAGFYPDIDGPGLYFELRFHQKAINPESWFTAN